MANGILVFNRSNDVTISNAISGGGALTKMGAGTLTLSGNNSAYSGTTTISSGALKAGSTTALGGSGSSLVIHCNSTYVDLNGLNVGSGTSMSVVDDGSVVQQAIRNSNSSVMATFGGSITVAISMYVGGGVGDIALSGNITGTMCVVSASRVVALSGNNSNLSWLDIYSGTVRLDGDNALSTSTAVSFWNGGTLNVNGRNVAAGKFYSRSSQTTGTVLLGGGTLAVGGSDVAAEQTFVGTISGTGSLVKQGAGDGDSNGQQYVHGHNDGEPGTLQIGGGGTSGAIGSGNIVANGILVFNRSNDVTISNAISGGGALTKMGAGTLTLSGNNSAYSGATTISSGALKAGSTTALGGSGSSLVIHCNSTYVDLNGMNVGSGTSMSVLDDGSVVQQAIRNSNSSVMATFGGSITVAISMYVGGGVGDIALSGNITGTMCVVSASRVVSLSGNNSNLSWLDIYSGTVRLDADNALSTSTAVSFWNGGTLNVNGRNVAAGKFYSRSSQTTGTVLLGGGTLAVGGSDVAAEQTFVGTISGTGSLVKQGAGTEILTGSNTYTGTTTVIAGTLQIGGGGTSGAIGSGNIVANGILVFNRSNDVTISNAISGGGALTKMGAGTLTLSGNNSAYSGTTTISSGALKAGSTTALGGSGSSLVIHCNSTYVDLNGLNVGSGTSMSVVDDGSVVQQAIRNSNSSVMATFGGSITVAISMYVGGGVGDIALLGNITGTMCVVRLPGWWRFPATTAISVGWTSTAAR